MDTPAIRITNLRKRYPGFELEDVSFTLPRGYVMGLVGPNGAGKTTLVKQIIGLLKPTSGELTLGPYDLVDDPDAARQLCSYLPQAQMLVARMFAEERPLQRRVVAEDHREAVERQDVAGLHASVGACGQIDSQWGGSGSGLPFLHRTGPH